MSQQEKFEEEINLGYTFKKDCSDFKKRL